MLPEGRLNPESGMSVATPVEQYYAQQQRLILEKDSAQNLQTHDILSSLLHNQL